MTTLGFEVEWFDTIANSCQILYLKYFVEDGTVELINSTKNTTFLKRIFYPGVVAEDLFIGNSITIYNRLLTITKYANNFTEDYMMSRETHVVVTVGRDDGHLLGPILTAAAKLRLKLGRSATTSRAVSLRELSIRPEDEFIMEFIARSCDAADAFIEGAQNISGAVTAITAEASSVSQLINAASPISVPVNCTLCIVKPHVLRNSRQHEVVSAILDDGRFNITGLMTPHLQSDMADEFFRVYRRIIPGYAAFVDEIAAGPVLALMITPSNVEQARSDDLAFDSIVPAFRELCGPNNCELAAVLDKNTLRARVGVPGSKTNMIQNGVHCTDLLDDGAMECCFFFETIAKLKCSS